MIMGDLFTLSAWRVLGTEVSPEDTALCCPLQARCGRTDIVTLVTLVFFFVSVLFIINISDNICKKHLNSLMEVVILLVNLFECVDLVGLANLCVRGERFTRHHLRSVH